MPITTRSLPARVALLVLATAACAASAQVYRIVGPDGRVTFSDKPPTEPGVRASAAPVAGQPASGGGGALPLELRQTVSRFPVTLYTGPNCAPCSAGRNFLSARGIPFAERTINTADDVAAFQRLSAGGATLPLLTIGGQQLKGYAEPEWAQYLDAAGYPQTSQLPANYRAVAPAPLVAVQPVAAPVAATAPAPAAAAPVAAPAPSGSNPAGITF